MSGATDEGDRSPRKEFAEPIEPVERPASPAAQVSADGAAPPSADKKKWTRGEEEKVGDEFAMRMTDGPSKVKAVGWNDTRSADDKVRFELHELVSSAPCQMAFSFTCNSIPLPFARWAQ